MQPGYTIHKRGKRKRGKKNVFVSHARTDAVIITFDFKKGSSNHDLDGLGS